LNYEYARVKMAKRKNIVVHSSIRERLGYAPEISYEELLEDWKKRSTQVCKPCWELKYCPYGPFVEQSPLLPSLRSEAKEHIEYLKQCLSTGLLGRVWDLDDETKGRYQTYVDMIDGDGIYPQELIDRILMRINFENRLEEAAQSSEEPLEDVLNAELGPIQNYRVPFPLIEEEEEDIREIKIPPEIQAALDDEIKKVREALSTGVVDNRVPLDNIRRLLFEKQVSEFEEEDYPEEIPEEIADMQCNIFGHICPVVFVGESIAEATEQRRKGRYIPFRTKIRVVRRDNYTCQECGKHLKDDEVEFDHMIPVSKGGSSEEHNIRLTCFDCNRDKSDHVSI